MSVFFFVAVDYRHPKYHFIILVQCIIRIIWNIDGLMIYLAFCHMLQLFPVKCMYAIYLNIMYRHRT